MLSINTNLSSLITQRSMKSATNLLNQAVERMSTGYKVNHAKDNAAAYSIITNMDTKISAYQVAEDNCAMGLDMLTTATESLDLIYDKLTRLRDLAEQASNGTYGEQSLRAINSEANALVDEINRLYETAEYNGIKLFGTAEEVTPMQASEPIATFAMSRAAGMPETNAVGFIKSIDVQDTNNMTTLASQASNADLADGTYSITTADEILKLNDLVEGGFVSENDVFVLGDNIDLTGTGFTGIGYSTSFNGVFDGNGYHIKLPTGSINLFYEIKNVVKNLSLEGNVVGSVDPGVLAHLTTSNAKIQNVTLNNTATTRYEMDRFASGLVGTNYGSIEDCYTEVTFTDSNPNELHNSSLVYHNANTGVIKNSYSVANGHVISLFISNAGTIDSCYGIFNNMANPSVVDSEYGTTTNSYVTDGSGNVTDSTLDWDGTKFTYSLVKPTFSAGTGGGTGGAGGGGGGTPSPDPDGGVIEGGTGTGGGAVSTLPSYAPGSVMLQIGVGSSWSSQIGVDVSFTLEGIEDLRGIGLDKTTDYFTILDDMLETIASKQVKYGAAQNKLDSALDEISTQYENLVSSRSTLRDADIAEVSSQYIQQQILQQASATLMATANQAPAIALQLI